MRTPTPFRLTSPVLLGLALLLPGLAPQAVRAETACDLQAAQADFEIGRLELVVSRLEPCAHDLEPSEQEGAYTLLAKAWLALDEIERADRTIASLLELNPSFRPAFDDPLPFVRRVQQIRDRQPTSAVVTSVSKTPESLREAPATVVVITAEEIERRGYLDLEQVLHDLPGFDFSRGNGDIYSVFYQRGYRSRNDRTLFLVDGIEENDLWSNAAHLSRQFPLSNVDRIEVIYGPASTLYGANAFAGVINVITRETEEMIPEGRRFATALTAGGGAWDTRWADVTLATRRRDKKVSLALSARLYQSDEWDLSEFPDWDYDPSFYDGLDYSRILRTGPESGSLSAADEALLRASPYVRPAAGGGFELTPAGAERARALDKAALAIPVEGRLPRYSDRTDDWSIGGRLHLFNLTLGFQTWRREEGFSSWYTDGLYAGADNGTLWVPQQSLFYVKYDNELSRRLALSFTSSYKRHTLGGDTSEQLLKSYANGGLGLRDLATDRASFWQETSYALLSEQFKGEATLVYSPSSRLAVVGGFDARNSMVQGDYLLTTDNLAGDDPQYFDELDVGAFAQASYRLRDHFKVVLGSRVDHNTQHRGEGYGTVASPRLAFIYSPSSWVLKAIYAEAFKAPSNFNRYATAPGLRELPNPALAPERVRNLEVSAGWQPRPELSLEAAAFQARYSDVVTTKEIERPNQPSTLQNQNLGSLEISGVQAAAKWRYRRLDLDASYTWTDPRTDPLHSDGTPLQDQQGRPIVDVRIEDIADHRVNLGLTGRVADRWTFNVRGNWASERRAGQNLDLLREPQELWVDRLGRPVDPYGERVDPSLVVNGAVAYENVLPGVRLQLVVNNLLDARYDDPGVSPADGVSFARVLPQPGRAVFLRLSFRR